MSPASSGSLEVERYIGACLISSQHTRNKNTTQKTYYHHQQQQQRGDLYNGNYISYRAGNSDGWAGGMPLISFANHQNRRTSRRHTTEEASRCASPRELAAHTQGLPLILTGRNGQDNRRPTKANPRKLLAFNQHPQGRGAPKKIGECKDTNSHHHGGVDTLSVASDESSGSNHSETSLPRIIKPRKRRKKDRKPHPLSGRVIETNINSNKYYSEFSENFINVTNSDHNNDSPQLHHRFEDVLANLEIEFDDKELSNCQCRYCDPAGQIWDVDKHCYSPFLTVPPLRKQLSTDSSSSDSSTSSRLSSALQSQCSISFSLDLEDLSENRRSCSSSSSSRSSDQHVCTPNRTQQCLEISTQIVTSPNGHRDLEIRLFSSEKLKFKDNEACLSPEE